MTDIMDEKSVENEEAKLVKEANSIEVFCTFSMVQYM